MATFNIHFNLKQQLANREMEMAAMEARLDALDLHDRSHGKPWAKDRCRFCGQSSLSYK